MPRLFVCVWIPEEIKKDIIEFQNKLASLPLEAKFVEKENLHLTITFLGDRNDINQIKDSLKKLSGFGKFKIGLKGLKIIPSEKYIRVIGVSISINNDVFSRLIRMTGSLVGGDYYDEGKMTLCRVKNISDKEVVMKFLKENKNISFGEFEVEKVFLVESVLTAKGPLYRNVFEVNL